MRITEKGWGHRQPKKGDPKRLGLTRGSHIRIRLREPGRTLNFHLVTHRVTPMTHQLNHHIPISIGEYGALLRNAHSPVERGRHALAPKDRSGYLSPRRALDSKTCATPHPRPLTASGCPYPPSCLPLAAVRTLPSREDPGNLGHVLAAMHRYDVQLTEWDGL